MEREGHKIVARNYKTYFYEIDIVSTRGEMIYFTEVKYRKTDVQGGGLAAVDEHKLKQMEYAAECFMRHHKQTFDGFNPLLAVADVGGEDFEVKEWFELN